MIACTFSMNAANTKPLTIVARNRKLVRSAWAEMFGIEPKNQVWFDEDGMIEASFGSGQDTDSPLRRPIVHADWVVWR